MTASSGDIEAAAAILSAGGLVAFPTETVYGLGADAGDPVAVGRVFAVKGRPADHPLIVHIAHGTVLEGWAAAVAPEAQLLADTFWPGPMTILLARGPWASDVVTGGRPTVGLRVPDHPVASALLRAFAASRPGRPVGIAAPSANRFGRVSPTTAAHVLSDLGDAADLVLDGGPCAVGVESTIVDCTGPSPVVVRLGGVSVERITEVLGQVPKVWVDGGRAGKPSDPRQAAARPPGGARAPGMLAAHYAPKARVELAVGPTDLLVRVRELADAGLRVAVLAPTVVDHLSSSAIELEPAGHAPDYARVLYDRLRQADRLRADVIVVLPPPAGGLGDTVRDRLTRASAAHQPR